ncbi:MAG TPA: glycosyl hydrolase [Solirubrobacterales bacterium]|nr:glycosyl hydrolase [Solirubrobacterales bacterium]
MLRFRRFVTLLLLAFALAALPAPAAFGAEGVGPAKKLGGTTSGASATTTTSSSRTSTASGKEALAIATTSPTAGQTLSGKVAWEIGVVSGAPSKVEFSIDGSVVWTDTGAPFAGSLDTAKLADGPHVLSATAYGAKGVKATAKVTVTVANAAPAPAPEPTPAPAPAPGSAAPIYWGATVGIHLAGTQPPWDMAGLDVFEEEVQKKVSMLNFFQPFANCNPTCSFYGFPKTPLESIRQRGAIPVLSWSSQSIPSSKVEPDFQLSDVISGRYDAYITDFATKAKAWGHPFFLRFNWEMNGKWFPWHEGVNGNQPGEFVAAWRHVHDIFTAVGATNVNWVWCPNLEYSGSTPLASVYPGDAYVDWTGLDGYNHGTNPAHPDSWKSFSQLYRSTYDKITGSLAPSKPLMIGEVASTEYGGSKSAWIKDMLARIPAEYPKIRALIYFDKYDTGMDWPLETSTGATTAFAEGIQDPAYLGNAFSGLGGTKILPLG